MKNDKINVLCFQQLTGENIVLGLVNTNVFAIGPTIETQHPLLGES